MVAVFGNCSLKVHVFLHLTGQEPITWKSSNVAIFYSPMKNKFVQLWSKNYGAFPFLFVFFVFFDTWTSWYIINNNNLLTESEGSTGKYPTEVLLYWPSDIQQDRGWIFSRTARTVEVSKFYIIWHCTFVKNGGGGGGSHARAKYKVRNICKKKTIVIKCSLG
jgi:hypothetical protein